MRVLQTPDERAKLLPKRASGLFLVLFFRSSELSADAIDICTSDTDAAFELVAVDLDGAPLLAERFALPRVPVLAVVFDGTILCLEDELSESSCRELAELALLQQKALLETSS